MDNIEIVHSCCTLKKCTMDIWTKFWKERQLFLSLRHFQFCFSNKCKPTSQFVYRQNTKGIVVSIVYLNIGQINHAWYIRSFIQSSSLALSWFFRPNRQHLDEFLLFLFPNKSTSFALISDKCVRVFWGTLKDSLTIFSQQMFSLPLF